jgi:iron complex outermembrane receptor protein
LLGNRLALTLGTQVQHDSDFGVGVQPTARVMWKALPRQRIWAATSRALRTPSLNERGIRLDYPPAVGPGGLPLLVSAEGNPNAQSERFVDAEVGYRLEVGTAASVDVTAFGGRYDHLVTSETSSPVVQLVPTPHVLVASRIGNELSATTRGLEVAGHWTPFRSLRVDGGYTAFHVTPHLSASSHDLAASADDGSAPSTQWHLRSTFSPVARATINAAVFRVGRLEQLQVSAYTRLDLSAGWRFSSALSAQAIGQNLLEAAHAEFGGPGSLLLATLVPRSASLQLRWTFR